MITVGPGAVLIAAGVSAAVYRGCTRYCAPKRDTFTIVNEFPRSLHRSDNPKIQVPVWQAEGIRVKPPIAALWLISAVCLGAYFGAAALPLIIASVIIGVSTGLIGFSSDALLNNRGTKSVVNG